MPSLANLLSFAPTFFVIAALLCLIIAEVGGVFHKPMRPRFLRYMGVAVVLLAVWWGAEYSHNISLTMPSMGVFNQLYAAQGGPATH